MSAEEDGERLIAPEEGLRLEDALRELRGALRGFDYGRSMEIASHLARFDWGEARSEGIKVVHAYIRRFDYDAAVSELDRNFPEAG